LDLLQKGVLRKFEAKKGELLIGKKEIKGTNAEEKLPADSFVPEKHILHALVRGFYKPAGKPYLMSYQATESDDNYGKQIIWKDSYQTEFLEIEMFPPDKPNDPLKESDINAARYNLNNNLPIGILHKVKKGHNRVLGLGKITSERSDGAFIIEPYTFERMETEKIEKIKEIIDIEDINTTVLREIKARHGQNKFRNKLLEESNECAICGIQDPFLIASHIKPWSFCNDYERLDVNNGLLLCPNHDMLFDKGYISFNTEGKIIISPLLTFKAKELMRVNEHISISVNKDRNNYMKWHMEYCFNRKF